jgi:putative FmdB family regulatory protein
MPIYNYQCKKCDHEFQDIRKYNDPLPQCPKCKGEVKKLFGATNFKLKYTDRTVTPGSNFGGKK